MRYVLDHDLTRKQLSLKWSVYCELDMEEDEDILPVLKSLIKDLKKEIVLQIEVTSTKLPGEEETITLILEPEDYFIELSGAIARDLGIPWDLEFAKLIQQLDGWYDTHNGDHSAVHFDAVEGEE